MTLPRSISVLKFGSSVLTSLNELHRVTEEIYRHRRLGNKVIAVVSAMGDTTDRLIREARSAKKEPSSRALALLLATGETRSVALVTLACQESGIAAAPIPAHEFGLLTDGDQLNARPLHVDTRGLLRQLEDHDVLVVPGFVGVDISGETSLLGRGGSDLTAVYLAKAVDAQVCCLLKDTAGVFESDPNVPDSHPRFYSRLSFEDAARIPGEVLQEKAVRYASRLGQTFEVRRIGGISCTQVGTITSQLEYREDEGRCDSVALLGHGQVGAALLKRLQRHSDNLHIKGVAVRNVPKHEGTVGRIPLTPDAQTLAAAGHSIVVEVIGSPDVALPSIRGALRNGSHVVTANKEVIAAHGDELRRLARQNHVELRCSAAVGASVPVIETLQKERAAGKVLVEVEGILNGTSNFILSLLEEGLDLTSALAQARAAGLCEAECEDDLNGLDAARKLLVLAQEGIPAADLDDLQVCRLGTINHVTGELCAAAEQASTKLRQVARLTVGEIGVSATVSLEAVPASSFLGRCSGAENRVNLRFADGTVCTLKGLGAGPAPTAEAVLADVLSIQRTARLDRVEVAFGETEQ